MRRECLKTESAKMGKSMAEMSVPELEDLVKVIIDRIGEIKSAENNSVENNENNTSEEPQQMDTTEEVNKTKKRIAESSDSEEEEFKIPKKTKTHRQYVRLNKNEIATTENRFAVLTSSEKDSATDETSAAPATQKKEKVNENEMKNSTPITLVNKGKWDKLNKLINEKKINYSKATNVSKGIEILPTTVAEYRKLRKLMENHQYEYFTHQLKQERNLKVVIRGVLIELEEERINEDLEEQGYTATKITRMNGKNGKPAPLILVEIDRKFNSIYKLTNVCGITVSVEPLKNNFSPTQCHRCQSFGHVQRNCTAEFKCLKCADSHSTHECTKPKTTAAKCANCLGPHPSNFHKCPQRPTPQQKPTKNVPAKTWNPIPQPVITSFAEIQKEQRNPSPNMQNSQPAPEPQTPKPTHNQKSNIAATEIGHLFMAYCSKNPSDSEKVVFFDRLQRILSLINV